MAIECDARDVLALYPSLGEVLEPEAPLPHGCKVLDVPAGSTVFDEEDRCPGFPLVVRGGVRVAQSSREGRSLELYRVVAGEICLVSAACVFRSQPLASRGEAIGPTTLVVIDAALFRRWLGNARFRDFILGVFAQRMSELSQLVEAVAFQRVDQRLAQALLGEGQEFAVTHQQLADRLGTVREIVTRVLRRFEQAGWIEHSRERIRIRDSAGLRAAAAGSVTKVTDS